MSMHDKYGARNRAPWSDRVDFYLTVNQQAKLSP